MMLVLVLLVVSLLPLTSATPLTTVATSTTRLLPQQVVADSFPTQTSVSDEQTVTTSSVTFQTAAPEPVLHIQGRQRCFNDQGFSVDCATWSGYRYTWGPPGNIYAGGPGDDGSGGGGTGIVSAAAGERNRMAFRFGGASMVCGIILTALAFVV